MKLHNMFLSALMSGITYYRSFGAPFLDPSIRLNNYEGVYYAGSQIIGRIECYFNEKITLRAIKIRIECKEHNEWTTITKDNYKYFHLGDNTILDIIQTLFGSDSESHHVLSIGTYTYPFSFVLPNDIPSSFTGRFGWISYKLRATVDRLTTSSYETELGFVVHSPIDFNRMPLELQNPASYSKEETVGSCCCQSGQITMDVEIPKKAFIPGEIIPLKVHVCNFSNRNVKNVEVLFRKLQKHKTSAPRDSIQVEVFKAITHMDHGVGAHGEHSFNIDFKIPEDLVAPNFSKCKLFEVTYVFKVICIMATCVQNVTVETFDIVVGHIPLRDRFQPSAPVKETTNDELAPPSYNEVMSKNHDLPSFEN